MNYIKASIITAVALTMAACTAPLVEPKGFACGLIAGPLNEAYMNGEITLEMRNDAVTKCNEKTEALPF